MPASLSELEARLTSSLRHAKAVVTVQAMIKPACTRKADRGTTLEAIHVLRRVFKHFLSEGVMTSPPEPPAAAKARGVLPGGGAASGDDAKPDPKAVLAQWLLARLMDFQSSLLLCLHNVDDTLQLVALRTALALAAHTPDSTSLGRSRKPSAFRFEFPVMVNVLYHVLCSADGPNDALMEVLVSEFSDEYDDMRYYLLKAVRQLANHRRKPSPSSKLHMLHALQGVDFSTRLFGLLDMVSIPPSQADVEGKLYVQLAPGKPVTRMTDLATQRKAFASAWLAFVQLPLSQAVYRQVLSCLSEEVIPHMPNPLLLSDFLSSAFAAGGVVSLLALDGLWQLMRDFNLDYPRFYHHLYALLTPETLHAKYRARFLKKLAMFMTSSQLSAYIVAAFAKRMARLALVSPPSVAMFAVPFIYNLAKKHPAVSRLLHRGARTVHRTMPRFRVRDHNPAITDSVDPADIPRPPPAVVPATAPAPPPATTGGAGASGAGAGASQAPTGDAGPSLTVDPDSGEDVFDAAADDPSKCRALESSLWEVTVLPKHYHPPVASLAKVFTAKWVASSMNPKPFFPITYDTMFATEVKRGAKAEVPTAFHRPPAFLTDAAAPEAEPIQPGASVLPVVTPTQPAGLFSHAVVDFTATAPPTPPPSPSPPARAAPAMPSARKGSKRRSGAAAPASAPAPVASSNGSGGGGDGGASGGAAAAPTPKRRRSRRKRT